MSGYAHHAYTQAGGPALRQPETRRRHDRRALAAVARARPRGRARTRSPSHLPIYLTEFGVQSMPNTQLGVSVAKQAEYDAIAEHIAWSNPRVAAFSQYLLRDDPLGGKPGLERRTAARRLPDRPGVRQRQAQAAVRRLAGAADGQHAATALLAVGPRAPGDRRDQGDGARAAQGLARATASLKTVTTNSRGYWALSSSTAGAALARALEEPAGPRLRRPADPRLLRRAPRRPPRALGAGPRRRRAAAARAALRWLHARAARGRDHRAPARPRAARRARSSRRSRPASTR